MVFNAYGIIKGLTEVITSAALVGVFGGVTFALTISMFNWLVG